MLKSLASRSSAGKVVEVEYLRDGRMGTAKVKVREQPPAVTQNERNTPSVGAPGKLTEKPRQPKNPSDLGISLQNVPNELRGMMGLAAKQGVLVGNITPGSQSSEAGLSAGDVILTVEDEPVSTVEEAESRIIRWLKLRKSDQLLLMLVQRGPGDRVFMAMPAM